MRVLTLAIVLILNLSLSLGEDFYELLGVSRTADTKEIRRVFKKLALTEHPDKNTDSPQAHEKFVKLTKAYEILKDPDLRKKYDTFGEDGLDNNNNRGGSYHSWNYYQNNFGIYDDDPRVVTLDANDYYESVLYSDKVWIVNFYSPMCSHCHHLAPTWKKIAKELEGVIRVGAVNCEDEWRLCSEIGIRSYPSLLRFPKNSKYGLRFTGEKSFSALMEFALEILEVEVQQVMEPIEKLLSHGRKAATRPMIMFVCGEKRDCLSPEDHKKIAAIFEDTIDVGVYSSRSDNKCDDILSYSTGAVYLSIYSSDSWKPVLFEDINDVSSLVEKVLEQLPEPLELDDDEFESIRQSETSEIGWLICFYIGRATELNLTLKRLPGIVKGIKLGKINCGRYAGICAKLSVNRYPMWGVLKPGGAFELNHGKDTINDLVKFSESSIKAKNVWALSADEVLSIMERRNDNGAWFLDWYAPWCPPCIQFLRELRRASLEFEKSVVRFGTIDCTVHFSICQRYNIHSYPTAMLINGSDTTNFMVQKTAANVVQFVNEARDPSVIRLTSATFDRRIGKRTGKLTWLVEYYAPWCGPCQRFAPEWTMVAKALNDLPFIKVANVDCQTEDTLCRSQGIRSYPTIRMYSIDTEGTNVYTPYNDQRDSISILSWAVKTFPTKVRDLDPSSILKEVINDKNVWVVDFFAPWCEHCRRLEPQFAIAAQLLKKVARFGRINCEMYGSECARAKIRAYPTILAYNPRQQKKAITNGVKINGTTVDTIRKSILEFTSRVKHDEL